MAATDTLHPVSPVVEVDLPQVRMQQVILLPVPQVQLPQQVVETVVMVEPDRMVTGLRVNSLEAEAEVPCAVAVGHEMEASAPMVW